jgi:phasin
MPAFAENRFLEDDAMTDRTSTARRFAEQSTAQAKRTFENAGAAGGEATRRIEDTYATSTRGAIDFHRKVLAIAQANVDAAFECAQQLVGVTSPSEFMEVTTSHARRQLQAMTEQSMELSGLARKAGTDSVKPLTGGFPGMFPGTT